MWTTSSFHHHVILPYIRVTERAKYDAYCKIKQKIRQGKKYGRKAKQQSDLTERSKPWFVQPFGLTFLPTNFWVKLTFFLLVCCLFVAKDTFCLSCFLFYTTHRQLMWFSKTAVRLYISKPRSQNTNEYTQDRIMNPYSMGFKYYTSGLFSHCSYFKLSHRIR